MCLPFACSTEGNGGYAWHQSGTVLLCLTLMHFVLHLYWWLQDLVKTFRWRIAANLMHGKSSLPPNLSVVNSATLLSAESTNPMASAASAASDDPRAKREGRVDEFKI